MPLTSIFLVNYFPKFIFIHISKIDFMNSSKIRLGSLLNYAKEAMNSKVRTVIDVNRYNKFHLWENEALTLEGLKLATFAGEVDQDGDPWLRLHKPRLKENAPSPSAPFISYRLELTNDPNQKPHLKKKGSDSKETQLGNREKYEIEEQFRNYVETTWKSWSRREIRRKKSEKVYQDLFTLYQQLGASASEEQVEIVWGIGIINGRVEQRYLNYPLVCQVMDLSFDDKDESICVRPRDMEFTFELDTIARLGKLNNFNDERALAGELEELLPTNPLHFEDLNRTFEDSRAFLLKKFGDTEVNIQNSWVLFVRPRSSNLAVQDLQRFRDNITADSDVSTSGAIKAFVSDPPQAPTKNINPVLRGISASNTSSEADRKILDLHFPKPFNDEQARLAALLEISEGVVVQGPPGTGKTHTIANVICHWLSSGKRVLVSSMREPALEVLRDMLPAKIQPLAISLLSNDNDGINQLANSIEQIAHGVQSMDGEVVRLKIMSLEEQIQGLHTLIQDIDNKIDEWADLNLSPVQFQNRNLYPQDVAEMVAKESFSTAALPDVLGVDKRFDPQFCQQDINRLRELLEKLGPDKIYIMDRPPTNDELPDQITLTKAHGDLQRFKRLSERSRKTEWPWPKNADGGTLEQARDLAKKVRGVSSKWGHLLGAKLPWSDSVVKRIRRGEPRRFFQTLDDLGKEIERLSVEQSAFLKKPVSAPEMALCEQAYFNAVTKLSKGKRPYSITSSGKGQIKLWLNSTRVGGIAVTDASGWEHVANFTKLYRRRQDLTARWNNIAPEIGLHPVLSVNTRGQLSAEGQYALYKALRELGEEQKKLALDTAKIFPDWAKISEIVVNPLIIDELSYALEYHLSSHGLSTVGNMVVRLNSALEKTSGILSNSLSKFLADKLGNPDIESSEILREWELLLAETKKINKNLDLHQEVNQILSKISNSGGRKFKESLITEHVDLSQKLPENFIQIWSFKRLSDFVRSIDSKDSVQTLSARRRELEGDLVKSYEKLSVEKTWLRLVESINPGSRVALQNYLNALQRIGKGTGKSATRYRAEARSAALECQKAVPCWIMPHHRVSETLPAEFGSFDLVIIDEASQSDLSALPVILRGKKVLIVGDHKQVAPQVIGFEEGRIKDLMSRLLIDQVPDFKNQMAPDRSIYDLARVVFANTSVMLREHFRCVAPIIEFSKREFYKNELQPLRLPLPSERISPPLVDILITNGLREKSVNLREVEFIVEEINRLCHDPKFLNRSIGVISLLGQEQANKIWEELLKTVPIEILRRNNVACGDARMFQGRERDIIFLSMVVAPNEMVTTLSGEVFSQRFNVATSRARDQMILVRSVRVNDLPATDSLRRSLIDHFSKPYKSAKHFFRDDARELCDSSVERELFDWLISNGYNCQPKVAVGIHIVDFVIYGQQDNRLAVECDGDKYHGSEVWVDSVKRQRALERMGWSFWRCFASNFILKKERVLNDLKQVLTSHKIFPQSGTMDELPITQNKEISILLNETSCAGNVSAIKSRSSAS